MLNIITDTTSCLAVETAGRYHVAVLPQIIHFGGLSFREGIDMDHADFVRWLASASELAKTSAPPPEMFASSFVVWCPPR